MVRKIKNRWRRLRLRLHGIYEELTVNKVRYGHGLGSWMLHPDALNETSIIYSFGIGTDTAFDLALIDNFRVTVHGFDPTPVSVAWLQTQKLPQEFKHHSYGLADYDGVLAFYPPRRATSAHYTPVRRYRSRTSSQRRSEAPVYRLATIMRRLGHDHIDLLKMDIEGGEYDVVADIVKEKIPIRQILVEFHHNYSTISFQKTIHALRTLRRVGFRVFDISERTYEISLLQRNPS